MHLFFFDNPKTHSLIGSIQVEGQAKQNKADKEYDASQATAKLPGATASSAGEITKDNPDRTSGAYKQTVGSAKETVGGLVGAEVSVLKRASDAISNYVTNLYTT